MLIEGGFAWLPPLMWRLDRAWKQLRAEVPHLTRLPSEYIREHIWLTTQPMEEPPRPEHFAELLEQLGMDDRMMFATDYPHWDFDAPDRRDPELPRPPTLRRAIMADNATGARTGSMAESATRSTSSHGRRDPAGGAQDRRGRRALDRRLQRRRRVLRAAQPLPAPGRAALRGRRHGALDVSGPASTTTARRARSALPLARLGVRHRTGQSWFDPQRMRVRSYRVSVEPAQEEARVRTYVAERYDVTVEDRCVVLDLGR